MKNIINELNGKGFDTMMLGNKLIVTIEDFTGFDENFEETYKEDYLVQQDVQLVENLLKGFNYELHYSSEDI